MVKWRLIAQARPYPLRKHLRWRALQQQLRLKAVNYCYKALHLRYLRRSWLHLEIGHRGVLICVKLSQQKKFTKTQKKDGNSKIENLGKYSKEYDLQPESVSVKLFHI